MPDLVAVIDGPFLTFRAWNTAGTAEAMEHSTVRLVCSYFNRGADVWIVWEQPGMRGLDFRRKIDSGYKARRTAKPDDYLRALDELQRALTWLGVSQAWPKEGEADDAAATLTRMARARGDNVELWALDHDWLQLVEPGVSLRMPKKSPETVTSANIVELTGGDAAWHLNLMSLRGDPGDDIPGLPRIGRDRARRLLELRPTIVQDILDGDTMAVERTIAAAAPNYLRWAQVAMDNVELLRSTRELVTLREVELMTVPGAGDLERATSWLAERDLDRFVGSVMDRIDPDPWLADDAPPDIDGREPWQTDHPASDPPTEPWQ